MSAGPALATRLFQGQPCVELTLPSGDRARVALFGAQVLSWITADGTERIYLSPRARLDGSRPIRGGMPLCFPQFNQRALGPALLPKHGFARSQAWQLRTVEEQPGWAEASLVLSDTEQSRAIWPHAFAATCTVTLEPDNLRVAFEVANTGALSWPFAFALHTYLQVDDIGRTELLGLQGLNYWDAVLHPDEPARRSNQGDRALRFGSETDRVYAKAKVPLMMRDGGGSLRIEQSASLPEVVVWNPGAVVCAALVDMPDCRLTHPPDRPAGAVVCAALVDMPADGFMHMLCVEAARVNTPQLLLPGESWRGWQSLRVMPVAFHPSGFAPL